MECNEGDARNCSCNWKETPGIVIVGVKRNAERYKFWEPRPPVDAVWARNRKSRFSMWKVQADVNFLVTFAKNALLGPKTHFGPIFRFLGPKIDFGARNALLAQKRLWAKKGSILVKKPLVL